MIYIESRRKSLKTLTSKYPNAEVFDVTSKGHLPFVKLSPFFPHNNIPVPFSENIYSSSVEGIWQGLKVFENCDVDPSKFDVRNMKNIKRSVRKNGSPKGHRKGITGEELLGYIDARKLIYVPTYNWMLQNKVRDVIIILTEIALKQDIVLLDYTTNEDIDNKKTPLSHAALVKDYLIKLNPEVNKSFS